MSLGKFTGALTIFSGVVASVDLAIEDKRFNGEMTQEEYNSDYYQTYRKAKVCLDVVTGIVNLPQAAIGLTKLTKSAILGSVRLGQKYIRNRSALCPNKFLTRKLSKTSCISSI